ncbi:MAG: polysaccharide biosynthesis/export family protein, partial [Pseudomonadales bacterium]
MQKLTLLHAGKTAIFLLFTAMVAMQSPAAALPEPTPQQLEIFSQLPPEQQQQLLRTLQEGGSIESISTEFGSRTGAAVQIDSARNIETESGERREDPYSSPIDHGSAQAPEGPGGETLWGYPNDPWLTGDPELYGSSSASPPPEARNPIVERDRETGLAYFGYEVFAGAPSTFAPVTDIPAPTDYVMAPGDSISIQLYGKEPGRYNLLVNRDGAINFPQLGPIVIAGLPFDEARRLLQARVAEQMIGTEASITLGQLRSIRVFVLGEVKQPGSFTVSSLSTV